MPIDYLSTIIAEAQRALGDPAGTEYTDAKVKGYIKSAQRKVVSKLREFGCGEAQAESSAITLPANTLSLTPTSTPSLPIGFVEPETVYEASVGATRDQFVKVEGPRDLPNIVPATSLRFYAWRGTDLYFLGATEDRDIIINYLVSLEDLTLPTDQLLLTGYAEPIGLFAAAAIVWGDSGDLAAKQEFVRDASEQLFSLANASIKAQQAVSTNRLRYNPGFGRYWG